ncbi:MAG: hypothetical protein CMK89_11320 [Pseudomonadales bacterium]|nr:hypothetical protein [Pseudomonadales bacterium]
MSLDCASKHYPFQTPPGQGEAIAINEQVKWLRSPLPLSLNHINCYLLRDEGGWCVVDTGMNGDAARQQWLDVIETQLDGEPITRVIVTHHHPDHVGLAGWLCDTHQVSLYTTEAEYLYTCAMNAASGDGSRNAPYWEVTRYFNQTGISETDRNALLDNKDYNHLVSSVPAAYHRIQDGDRIQIGSQQWEAITTRGHAPEHLCLYCRELDILISGDQVLPEITSNVSVSPTVPEDNPLDDWLQAHDKMATRVPDSVLVLPAHQLPFTGLHGRLQEVIEHHRERLDALLALMDQPNSSQRKSAQQLTREMFDKSLEPFQNFLAVGEVVAHLHYLLAEGRTKRELIGQVYYYGRS